MNDGAQLTLLDIGHSVVSAAAREADRAACVADKLDTDAFFGMLGDEEDGPDFDA